MSKNKILIIVACFFVVTAIVLTVVILKLNNGDSEPDNIETDISKTEVDEGGTKGNEVIDSNRKK